MIDNPADKDPNDIPQVVNLPEFVVRSTRSPEPLLVKWSTEIPLYTIRKLYSTSHSFPTILSVSKELASACFLFSMRCKRILMH